MAINLFNRSGSGLEVSQGALRAVGLRKKGGKCALETSASLELPPGLVMDSITEPNISDRPAFVEAVGKVLKAAGIRPGRIRVSLPDFAARVVILDFDSVQSRKEDTDRMLRWRVKKLIPFDIGKAELRYQYLGRFPDGDKTQHRYLACMVNTDILSQYGQAFSEAGLRPDRIDISSFAIWNLYRAHMTKIAGESQHFALLNIFGGLMTVLVFERGVLRFLRLKDLGKRYTMDEGEGVLSVPRIMREINASLTYYKENYSPEQVSRVFMAGDLDDMKKAAEEIGRLSHVGTSVLDIEEVISVPVKARRGPGQTIVYSAACGAALEC